jgi:hypothetical protein
VSGPLEPVHGDWKWLRISQRIDAGSADALVSGQPENALAGGNPLDYPAGQIRTSAGTGNLMVCY